MSDGIIALIVFAPFIIIFIGAIINLIGENRRNKRKRKRIQKVAEYFVGIGSLLGLVWVVLFLCFALPEINKVHRESRQLRESFKYH